eukprot:NODE_66_length_23959_cov_0.323009.p8 type:complete len:183 gc:universal NODE_66_length_23959_cov_0.323009:19737-19189(-)
MLISWLACWSIPVLDPDTEQNGVRSRNSARIVPKERIHEHTTEFKLAFNGLLLEATNPRDLEIGDTQEEFIDDIDREKLELGRQGQHNSPAGGIQHGFDIDVGKQIKKIKTGRRIVTAGKYITLGVLTAAAVKDAIQNNGRPVRIEPFPNGNANPVAQLDQPLNRKDAAQAPERRAQMFSML